jgi:hypothetical protein
MFCKKGRFVCGLFRGIYSGGLDKEGSNRFFDEDNRGFKRK